MFIITIIIFFAGKLLFLSNGELGEQGEPGEPGEPG